MAFQKPMPPAVARAAHLADAELHRIMEALQEVPQARDEGIAVVFLGSDPHAHAAYEALAALSSKLPPTIAGAPFCVVFTPYDRFMKVATERYGVSPHDPPSCEPGTLRVAVLVEGGIYFHLFGTAEALAKALREPPDRPLADAPDVFEIHLRCDRCGTDAILQAHWVYVHPAPTGWDGIVAGRIFRCASCGATDEYTIGDSCCREVRDLALRHGAPFLAAKGGPVGSHMNLALRGRSWRRPSHALRELGEMACADAAQGLYGWRLYSAFCEHLQEWEAAVDAHRATLALDPGAVGTSVCLAYDLLQTGKRGATTAEAMDALRDAIAGLPRADIEEPAELLAGIGMIVQMLRRYAELFDTSDKAELSLHAEWTREGGRRAKGAVRLTGKMDWEALAAFLGRRGMLALSVGAGVAPGEAADLPRELAAWRKKAGKPGN